MRVLLKLHTVFIQRRLEESNFDSSSDGTSAEIPVQQNQKNLGLKESQRKKLCLIKL